MEVELNNLTDPRPPADPAAGPDASVIAPKIRDFVARNFLFSEQGFQYEDDASFLGEGIIDSLGIIELVPFVEKTFGIAVADHELLPNNFDSVRKLTSFIARKLGAAS